MPFKIDKINENSLLIVPHKKKIEQGRDARTMLSIEQGLLAMLIPFKCVHNNDVED